MGNVGPKLNQPVHSVIHAVVRWIAISLNTRYFIEASGICRVSFIYYNFSFRCHAYPINIESQCSAHHHGICRSCETEAFILVRYHDIFA